MTTELERLMNGEQVDAANARGQKNDPPLAPTGPYGHGPNGLFNIPSTNDNIFSAMILPQTGAIGQIPVIQNDPGNMDDANNLFGSEITELDTLLTGVTEGALDDFENQPTESCEVGPVGGLTKLCTIVNTYGRFRVGIREIDTYRAGLREDRCDPLALQLLNSSQPLQGVFGVASDTPTASQAIMNEVARRMWESAVSFRRMLARRVWIGTPANNSGQRRDILGLDAHINQGNKVDFRTSAVCDAADSVVLDFGFDLVGGNGRDIIEYLEAAEYEAVEWNGGRMGLQPIAGFVAMHPVLWRELTKVIPVRQYQESLNQIANFDPGGRVVVNANDSLAFRNQMRQQAIVPLNGRNYIVVPDDSISEETPNTNANLNPGQYASDVYFIPLTVLGGIPSTFFSYHNHNNMQAVTALRRIDGSLTWTSDNGLFRWYLNFKNGCIQLSYEMSPKLRMKTPMVAWRVQNVAYEPLLKSRSFDPSSEYFANGGVTEQPPRDSYYTMWSPTTPTQI